MTNKKNTNEEYLPITLGEAIKQGYESGKEVYKTIKARNHIVADRLLYLRKKNRLTQSKLCESIDINRITYASYENERAAPSTEVLVRIADFYGVSVDFIVGRTNSQEDLYKKSAENSKQEKIEALTAKYEELARELQELKGE